MVMDDSCYSGEEAFSILGIFWDVISTIYLQVLLTVKYTR